MRTSDDCERTVYTCVDDDLVIPNVLAQRRRGRQWQCMLRDLSSGEPMNRRRIFYYCTDSNRPHGGEKHCYQHVDVLNRNGYDAYAIHRRDGFRFTWFDNETRVTDWTRTAPDPTRDYLVLPEIVGLRMSVFPGRKVVFNKNIYHGFTAMGYSPQSASAYLADDVVAILSISPHNVEHLRFAYPDKHILLVHPNVQPDVFTWKSLSSKRLLIAYTDKAEAHGRTLYHMLRGRAERGLNRTGGVQWIPIVELPQDLARRVLQDAFILVFFSVNEGFGRLPLEAMASGCLVCAYSGGPPSAYLPPYYQFAHGDLLAVARRIEQLVDAFPDNLQQFDELTAGARRIAEQYSAIEQERSVIEAWECILAHSG